MKTLSGFTTDGKQQSNIVLEDGSVAVLLLEFSQMQMGWFFDITWKDIALNGQRLTAHPNILRQQRNIIPFGIAIFSNTGAEPLTIDDLSNGSFSMYLLEGTDIELVETSFFTP